MMSTPTVQRRGTTSASPLAERARELMLSFGERTGLSSDREPRRYLWTDAFAVANYLELSRLFRDPELASLATDLIDQVHRTLGRHRADSARSGWLSGLGDSEGQQHPTLGGLRIGKPLPERAEHEPWDERLEWDRDGQYFHYLTKWMQALDRAAQAQRAPHFNLWARELAEVACRRFTLSSRGGSPRLAWKMRVDLSGPLVASSGQHDALDGFVTCSQLRATSLSFSPKPAGPRLDGELQALSMMLEPRAWPSADPLGIGGLLLDACRVEQLVVAEQLPEDELLGQLLLAALTGFRHYAESADLRQSAEWRVAFRELGLAIGLSAIELMSEDLREHAKYFHHEPSVRALLAAFAPYGAKAAHIRSFWLDPEQRRSAQFQAHRDINEVMLASSLIPEAILGLRLPP